MKTYFDLQRVLLAAALIIASSSAVAQEISIITNVDAMVKGLNPDTGSYSLIETETNNRQVGYWPSNFNRPGIRRVIAEIDLSLIPEGASITSAEFEFDGNIPSSSPRPITLEIYGYNGNGSVDPSDFFSNDVLLGTVSVSSASFSVRDEIDVTAWVQSLRANNTPFAGFLFRSKDEDSRAFHGADIVGTRAARTASRPKLRINLDTDNVLTSSDPIEPPSNYNSLCDSTGIKNMVVLTHGWNSDVGGGADITDMTLLQDAIQDNLASTTDTCVFVYDWRDEAGTGFLGPSLAWIRARTEGVILSQLLEDMPDLEYVHFIAHSAGSNLIQSAIRRLRKERDDIVTMGTFLDSFHPTGNSSYYGRDANWSEQYVDRRASVLIIDDYIVDLLDRTDILFENATNFAVEDRDPDERADNDFRLAHGWPIVFYKNSVSSASECVGFNLSFESGNMGNSPTEWANNITNRFSKGDSFELESNDCTPDREIRTLGDNIETLARTIIRIAEEPVRQVVSGTGMVLFDPIRSALSMFTGSPAWVKYQIPNTSKVNTISFDFEFTSTNGRGGLTALVNNEALFFSDEKYESGSVFSSGDLYFDETSDEIELSFRLDDNNENQSSIEITNIQFKNTELTTSNPEDQTMCFPVKTANGRVSVVCM